jgi:haloalkane dehalogenase
MQVYRTPEAAFADLPGYAFAPHYIEFEGMRMHYLDEGEGDPILLLHGEPTWSYLYRKMIPPLAEPGAGTRRRFRVIAPDYLGFGRSDKPLQIEDYTYDLHVASIHALVDSLDLRRITVVVQDWGGPIGLRVATESKDRFARLVVLNTGLFASKGWPTPGFMQWRNFAERVGREMPVGRIIQSATTRELDDETLRGYEAPWPGPESKAGVAAFPLLVPLTTDDPNAAAMLHVMDALRAWDVPALVCWSDSDPVFPLKAGEAMARLLPGAAGEVHQIPGASHMLQEDEGEQIADLILEWTAR